MKKGRFSAEERAYVEKHVDWTPAKIAKNLDRSVDSVNKVIQSLKSPVVEAAEPTLQEKFNALQAEFNKVTADLNDKNLKLKDIKKATKPPKGVAIFTAADSAKADESLKNTPRGYFREDCMISQGRPEED